MGDSASDVTGEPQASSFVTRRRLDWFLVAVDDVRVRSPADVGMVLFGLALILLTAWGSHQIEWLVDALGELIALLPAWLGVVFKVTYGVGLFYALWIIGVMITQGASRRSILRDLVLAGVGAGVITIVLGLVVSGEVPHLLPELYEQSGPIYPVARVAFVTAILLVSGPFLVQPFRRFGWLLVLVLLVSAVGLGVGLPADAIGGLGVGFVSAGLVMVIFGSTRGLPDPIDVRQDLEVLGVRVEDLTPASFQTWGARDFVATRQDDSDLAVRVYGRDARDAQMIAKWWRSVWYRDTGPALTTSRLHQVEHEALLTIGAGRAGVRVPDVLVAADPSKRASYLVTTREGTSLAELDGDDISDAMLADLWQSVGRLHTGDIAHGRLNLHAVRFAGEQAELHNFNAASVAPPDLRREGDIAELLASLTTVVGTERAVSTAIQGLGEERLAAALPYIQRSAVSSEGRADLPSRRGFFPEIRTQVADQTDSELPKVAQIRRLNWRSLLMFALTLLAGYALIGMLSGIDFAAVWEELQNADWAWILFALVPATLTLVSDAYVMLAAVGVPIPLTPAVNLQSSIKFIQLAIGGAAGRMATNIAFLRKYGVSATDAVTRSGVDSFTGFIVQAAILLMALIFGGVDLIPEDASIDVDWLTLIVLIGFAVVISWLMWRFIPAIRERVMPAVKQMWDGLKEIGTDPSRLLQLFGANLVSQLLFGLSLWMTAFAFGYTLPFMAVVVAYIAMALLSGLLPIPGGVGVSEAVLTAALVAIGVPESPAFAIAVVFRVLSAYLPPVWGWFSLQWLQKNEYL